METETADVTETNLAPASETPNTPTTPDAPAASPGADSPEKPKDRGDFIRQQVDAKRATEAEKDAKVQRRAPEGQFKRGPGRPSKAEIAAREAAKAKTVEKTAETPAAAPAKPAATPAVAETAQPQAQPQAVPSGLRAQFKATFGQLPKEWQEEIARLDKSGAELGSKYAPDLKFANEVRAEIQPFEMMIRAEGGTPQTAIRALLKDAALFRIGTPQQKQQRLMEIAKTYNVPLQAAAAEPGAQPESALPDISSHPVVQQLMGTVQQLQQGFTQQTQAQVQAQETANLEAVNSFLAESDEKGNLKFPLDDSLQAPFAQEIALVRQLNPNWDARRTLEKAHENLSWKVPELRAVILQKQEAEKQAKAAQELAAKRQAAVSLRPGAPATAAANSKPQNRAEFLKEQLAGIRG
jgi:hypothetical protein